MKWVSPINHEALKINNNKYYDHIRDYDIVNGEIINLIEPKNLNLTDQQAMEFYSNRSDDYEKYLHLTFQTYGEDENSVRNYMINKLQLSSQSKVLEIACGTGRDSVLIEKRLDANAELWLADISYDMIRTAKEKLKNSKVDIEYCLANAMNLPCPDNYFDAVYSFGALGEFSDPTRFFEEIIRVCKPGAMVVVGDENLPLWQRNTMFGKILANYNPQFKAEIPFASLPVESRNVCCEWIIGGVFYLINFRVGTGELKANFDFKIPGIRGGTHKTRFYGQLEGVNQDTKELAWRAVQAKGISMHEWLDELVRNEALKVISKN